ncbi:MAG: DUF11 domain-containing protein [Acidobacteria bacterium]|nr:DUF11 domain-containing protein [Acidobacteriota bacterium]
MKNQFINITVLSLVLIFITFLSPANVTAGIPVTVTVTVERVNQLYCDEDYCWNDLYSKVNIADIGIEQSPRAPDDEKDISPNWQFTRVVDSDAGTIPILIQIWDHDSTSGDDLIDIADGDSNLVLLLDLNTGGWTGKVPPNERYSFGSNGERAEIWFNVTVSGNDIDRDGIADNLEMFGLRDAGGNMIADFPALGADPCRPTVAVEIDYMQGAADGHTHRPTDAAMNEIVAAFNAAPVPAVSPCPYADFPQQPSGVNFIYTRDDALPEQQFMTWGGPAGQNGETIRNANFDARLRPFFQYSLWAHNQGQFTDANGVVQTDGSSGLCCSDSNKDALVTLGSFTNQVGSTREQSGTLMHELGHAYGFEHGGSDGINCKPNYISIMSYAFQTTGIPQPGGIFRLDYSRAALPTLNENSLVENIGIGDGTDITTWTVNGGLARTAAGNGAINWNGNTDATGNPLIDAGAVVVDINNFNITGCGQDQNRNSNTVAGEMMNGFNDWANLKYRAVLSPNAGFVPPVERELTAEDALQLRQQLLESLKPDPAVSIAVTPGSVVTGSNVTYTITLVNNRPTIARDVVVTDVLPASTNFVSCSSTGGGVCGGTGNNRAVTFAELAGNATVTITITATVNCSVADGSSIGNTVSVSSSTPDADTNNNSATASINALNPPPVISNFLLSETVLTPPNHKMRDIFVSYDVTDNCGTPTISLSVTSNEPVNGLGDGNTAPDWEIVNGDLVRLRAERSGLGNGRIYTVKITAADSGGGSSSQTATVFVPHN